MKRYKLLLLVALLVAASAIIGTRYGVSVRSQEQPFAAGGGMPVSNANDGNEALRSASAKAGFPAKVPEFLATSANRLVLVDASTGPPGASSGLRLIELVYESDRTMMLRGQQFRVSTEIFLTNVRLAQPAGDRQAEFLAGYEIFSLVVDRDQAGAPAKVSYTALGKAETIIIDFTGEQPTQEGLAKMLASFRTAP